MTTREWASTSFARQRRRLSEARPPRATLLLAALSVALSIIALAPATPASFADDGGASWTFAPAEAPPPPAGVPPASFPVPLGEVGDIQFWAPNRGLLITGGTGRTCAASANAAVPCGLYAYNGRAWHLLSTECGGANGRIAWAGPDEFWTISDQRPGQTLKAPEFKNLSLCHFLNGQVVASYAMPLEQPDSYRPMDAAACLNPDDCWFGGLRGLPPNHGAFHLHWDGQNMNVVYSSANQEVSAMALANQSTLLESVQVGGFEASESEEHPTVLHQIEPFGAGSVFENLTILSSACGSGEPCPPLPDYGSEKSNSEGEQPQPVDPLTLAGFSLSSTFTPSGSDAEAPQLWAVAGLAKRTSARRNMGNAHPIALRYSEGAWTQVVGGKDPGGDDPFGAGEVPTHVAAEPGAAAAWVAMESEDGQAHVDRLTASGTVSEADVLGEAQGVGKRGSAGPIACPAPHDCWMASREGWLFHLTSDAEHPEKTVGFLEDTDPNFAVVITSRPSDPGVPQLPPAEPPPDNSLANQEAAPSTPPTTVEQPVTRTSKPLITGLRSHVVHRDMLELSFKLTVKARVQLLASRKGRGVARTPVQILKAGKHTLTLKLNPRMWPTKLNLKATPLEALPTTVTKGGSGGGGASVAPPVKEERVAT